MEKSFSLIPDKLQTPIKVSLFLYGIALLISMAGMEIFGWLTALFSLICIGMNIKRTSLVESDLIFRFVDIFLLSLFIVTVIGAIFNAPESANTLDVIGRARWIFLYWLLAFALRVKFGERFRKFALFTFCFILFVIFVYAVFQYYTGRDLIRGPTKELGSAVERGIRIIVRWRAIGFYGMSMTFGHGMGVLFACLLGMLLCTRIHTKRFYILLVLTGFAFVSSFLSYQRGVWLGLIAVIGVLVFLRLQGRARLGVVTGLALLFLGLFLSHQGFHDRFVSMFDMSADSQSERINLWKANFEIFKDYPIFGVGYGENENIIGPYLAKIGLDGSFRGHAHNNFIQFLSGTGLLGFLSYIGFFVCLWIICIRGLRRFGIYSVKGGYFLGVLGAQVMIHIGGLTECSFKDAEVNHQLIFHFALIRAIWSKSEPE